MGIADRNLAPGTKLVATYKKETYHALVVAGPEGKLLYQLSPYDGREFKSLSSLGTAVTGKACNGWAFWSVATGDPQEEAVVHTNGEQPLEATEQDVTDQAPPEDEVPPAPDEEAPPETAPEQATVFRRVPNQRGVPEGEVRLYCDTCRESFTAPVDQQPETCPQGHRPGDAGAEENPQS